MEEDQLVIVPSAISQSAKKSDKIEKSILRSKEGDSYVGQNEWWF